MRREEEIDLIRKAKGGDTSAFTVMIRRYRISCTPRRSRF